MSVLTQERLKEVLHYDQNTGIFTWKVRSSYNVYQGDVAGCINGSGYSYIGICGVIYKSHRLAWLYVYGYFPENGIDHINREKTDNRIKNLREVSHICNMRNRRVLKNNSSGITGVYFHKISNKWVSQIKSENKRVYLGSFKSKTKAAKARWEAEKRYNFPSCNTVSSAYLYLKEKGEI